MLGARRSSSTPLGSGVYGGSSAHKLVLLGIEAVLNI